MSIITESEEYQQGVANGEADHASGLPGSLDLLGRAVAYHANAIRSLRRSKRMDVATRRYAYLLGYMAGFSAKALASLETTDD